jgi:CHAT domain-containing protein
VAHFSAHALVDSQRPGRSAVVLAADSDADGLLQPRDLSEAFLGGALVVLSACSSAGGEAVPGEGVFGLARAFLAAGAGAVLANLAPVDDRAARVLMGRLYEELERGRPVGRSLAAVAAELSAQGRPASEWGTTVLIGDGQLRLRSRRRRRSLPVLLGAFMALVLLAQVSRRVAATAQGDPEPVDPEA